MDDRKLKLLKIMETNMTELTFNLSTHVIQHIEWISVYIPDTVICRWKDEKIQEWMNIEWDKYLDINTNINITHSHWYNI